MKNRRQEIEQFCRNFLKGDNIHLHRLIDNYRHLFTQINIRQLDITQETFDRSFKTISKMLFNTRSTDKSYIIALLGFALTLNENHLSYYCSWYCIDMLIDSLTDVLEDINFQPKELISTKTDCIIL